MTTNSNENIKEIFINMITEVDENALKSYVESLSKYLKCDKNNSKSNEIYKITELINKRKQQLSQLDNEILAKTTQLNIIGNKLKNSNDEYNVMVSKIKQTENKLLNANENYDLLLGKIKQKEKELSAVNATNYNSSVEKINYKENELSSNEKSELPTIANIFLSAMAKSAVARLVAESVEKK